MTIPMRMRTRTFTLVVAVTILARVSPSQEPQGRAADERAIKEVIAGTTEAFNKHDAAAFVRFYTPDADLVTVRGESMSGAAEIERGLSRIFATRAQKVTLRTLAVRIRFIRPDVAAVHVTNELSGLRGPDGGSLPPHQELSVRLLVKNDGVWRVTAFHNTIVGGPNASPGPEDKAAR